VWIERAEHCSQRWALLGAAPAQPIQARKAKGRRPLPHADDLHSSAAGFVATFGLGVKSRQAEHVETSGDTKFNKGGHTMTFVSLAGMAIFAASSAYFWLAGKDRDGLNPAFLVSFITLVSYTLMWQGTFATRWLFYALSCTLLMYEIAQQKRIQGPTLVKMLYLTATVMLTGYLAALTPGTAKWVYFAISSVAYVLLVARVLAAKGAEWVSPYIYFGWTVFPVVFALAPTGLGIIGAALAHVLYLALDVFTKIVFNFQLERVS
jgi:bacteriorhodopsin